jgi:MFS transporter, Spinster family, sphingosine-1-phosphate transporter
MPRWAWWALALLFLMHILETIGRWLVLAVQPQLRDEFKLDEGQMGWLSTTLLLGLALASPPLGYVVDRVNRVRLLAIGFAVWSLATVSTGLASSYTTLEAARAAAGAGGALVTLVGLTMLMDLFPRTIRARALALFFLAVPLGAAVALSLGAAFARVTAWQTAFLAVGAPGLALALVALALPDPVRGTSDLVDVKRLRWHEQLGPSQEDYIDLMVNSSYTYSVFGFTFSSFALAGLVYWSPTFLTVVRGFTEAQAASRVGWTFLAAAVIGTLVGGWLADWASRRMPKALFLVPALAMLAAIPAVLLAIYGTSRPRILAGLLVSEGVLFMNVVPCYTILAGVVMPNMRGVACAVALAAVHLLGDIWSPTLMGWTIDTFGQTDSMATIFGRILTALGAVPVAHPGRDPENLTAGMLVVVPALFLAGAVFFAGSRHVLREMALMLAKLRAVPSRAVPAAAARRQRS